MSSLEQQKRGLGQFCRGIDHCWSLTKTIHGVDDVEVLQALMENFNNPVNNQNPEQTI